MKRAMLAACMFLLGAQAICAQENPTLHQQVVAELDKKISEYVSGNPDLGMAVAVVDDQRIVWEKVFGAVDGAGSRPIDANTIFSIQSMSKNFTAMAVLMAVQDGLVDLDAPIKEYLPGFTINSRYDEHPEGVITLRLLLTHRAGLCFEAPYGNQYDDQYDFVKHCESISKTWLRYPVGYRMAYSNLGSDLAAYILQKRTGIPFEQYVKEKVLDPIGMGSSSLDMTEIEKSGNRAIGHSTQHNTVPLRIPMIGAGGVYSNIHDMAGYLRFHINKGVVNGRRILRADLIETMHTVQFARPGQRCGYGLGINRDPISNSYNIYHSGGGYGFSSDMVMYPELKLGVVVLWNSMDNELTGNSLREVIDRCIVARNGRTPIDPPGTDTMIKLGDDDPRIQAVLGSYGDERVGSFAIERSDSCVGFRASPEEFYKLEFYDDRGEMVGMLGPVSEVRFLRPYADTRGAAYIINRLLGTGAGYQTFDFNHASDEAPGPNKPEWSRYVGDYEVWMYGVPAFTPKITIRNGYLCYMECKCTEYAPGLFFSYDGEALDFRSETPTFGGIVLRKK